MVQAPVLAVGQRGGLGVDVEGGEAGTATIAVGIGPSATPAPRPIRGADP